MSKRATVPIRSWVSKAALLARINRQLAKEGDSGQALKATRGERARQDLGDYYILDFNMNAIMGKDIDPAELARSIGVLKPYEFAPDFED